MNCASTHVKRITSSSLLDLWMTESQWPPRWAPLVVWQVKGHLYSSYDVWVKLKYWNISAFLFFPMHFPLADCTDTCNQFSLLQRPAQNLMLHKWTNKNNKTQRIRLLCIPHTCPVKWNCTHWGFVPFFIWCPRSFSKLSNKTQNKLNIVCPISFFFLKINNWLRRHADLFQLWFAALH